MTGTQGRHIQAVEALMARIAEIDPADPASLADRFRLQAELAAALKMATTGTPRGTKVRRHRGSVTPEPQQRGKTSKPASPRRGPAGSAVPPSQKPSDASQPRSKTLSLPIAIPSGSGALQQWRPTEWGRLVHWCEDILRNPRSLSPLVCHELEALQELLWKMNRLWNSEQKSKQIAAVHTQLQKVHAILTGPPSSGAAKSAAKSAPKGPPKGPRPSISHSSGAKMAVYNRLQQVGKNLSYEESIALRQGSRRQQRKLVSQIDRATAGGQDEIDDIDW